MEGIYIKEMPMKKHAYAKKTEGYICKPHLDKERTDQQIRSKVRLQVLAKRALNCKI